MIRVAVAAYPVERLGRFQALEAKLDEWVSLAAAGGAELAILPEYAGIEAALASATPDPTASDVVQIAADIAQSAAQAGAYRDLVERLARRYKIHLVAGSLPVEERGAYFNRAYVAGPDGLLGWQDKCILTPWERQHTPLRAARRLCRFTTAFGTLGVLICYDSEFPLLARKLGVDLLAVPSCTDSQAGQARVRIAARARALESYSITCQAPLLGGDPTCPLVDVAYGQAGVFAPPDLGFPDDGILADGASEKPGWVFADFDPAILERARAQGAVAPHRHWPESARCAPDAPNIDLDLDAPLN